MKYLHFIASHFCHLTVNIFICNTYQPACNPDIIPSWTDTPRQLSRFVQMLPVELQNEERVQDERVGDSWVLLPVHQDLEVTGFNWETWKGRWIFIEGENLRWMANGIINRYRQKDQEWVYKTFLSVECLSTVSIASTFTGLNGKIQWLKKLVEHILLRWDVSFISGAYTAECCL